MYFSRSENSKGEKEPLELHLEKVKMLCSEFAGEFGESIAGSWIGVLHDMGKASENFQMILEGTKHHMNHEAAGAYILWKYAHHMLSRVIYAHHKGLKWDIEQQLKDSFNIKGCTDLNNRQFTVSGADEYKKAFEYVKKSVGFPKEKPIVKENTHCKNKNISSMLHIRMLLSCLADADYTASASHEDEDIISKSTDIPLNPVKIIDSLNMYRDNIKKKSKSNSELNEIRNQVYDYCTEAGKKESGLYTLTAPTGTGKTLALLSFAVEQAKNHCKSRIIIVLPYLSIINQNAEIYREICDDILETHSMAKYDEQTKLFSERWTSPVIITTSVKFFESLFKSKPSNLRFIHSIANSVVVFDEAQSIPHDLIGATIETVNTLCDMFNCTVLFSTATQPAFKFRNDILNYMPKEIIPNSYTIYNAVRRVKIKWDIKEEKSFEEIAEQMLKYDSVCCVVNRKDHAYKLFKLLGDKEGCYHISTDMCKEHRENVLAEINERIKNKQPCRLVSTSCIEAGVDLDFEYMYRSLAPLDSIIQCAGRCNRNGNNNGIMSVFIPAEAKKYPSVSYENAASVVRLILSRHEIDIYSPEDIEEYYSELFKTYSKDNEKLIAAIEDNDFEEAEKQYRFIPSEGSDVLVPYADMIELYEELCFEARKKGISKEWRKRAAPLIVSSYRKDKLDDIGEQCFVYKKGEKIMLNNTYILNDSSFYDIRTGLHFEDDSSLNYCF